MNFGDTENVWCERRTEWVFSGDKYKTHRRSSWWLGNLYNVQSVLIIPIMSKDMLSLNIFQHKKFSATNICFALYNYRNQKYLYLKIFAGIRTNIPQQLFSTNCSSFLENVFDNGFIGY